MTYEDLVANGLELLRPFIGTLLVDNAIVTESLGPTAWWIGLGILLIFLKWRLR